MITEVYGMILDNGNEIDELYNLRGIVQDYQKEFLEDYGIVQLKDVSMLHLFNTKEVNRETGLFTETGYCILKDRYIIPVTDISGELLTLIGYYPDVKKYITLPTPNFSKSFDWFNIHQAYIRSLQFGGLVYICEGIFDTLMLAALGLPAIGAMGAQVGSSKGTVLEVFKKAICIPDADEVGQHAKNRWRIPIPHTFVQIPKRVLTFNDKKLIIKDPDDIVKYYPREGLYDMLLALKDKPGTSKFEVLAI